jgi:hypothetical protein
MHLNASMDLLFWLTCISCLTTSAAWYAMIAVVRTHGHAVSFFKYGIGPLRQLHKITRNDVLVRQKLRYLLVIFYVSWLAFIFSGASVLWLLAHYGNPAS